MARTKKATQAQLAKLVGITQQAVSDLLRKGILTRGGSLHQWNLEYCGNLREQAAGRQSENGKLDLIQERAALAREQRIKTAMENAIAKKELWTSRYICEQFQLLISNAKTGMLAVPSRYRSFFPGLTPNHIDILDTLVREVLDRLSHAQLPADLRGLLSEYFSQLEASAEANGERVGGSVPISQPRKQRRAGKVVHKKNAVLAGADG